MPWTDFIGTCTVRLTPSGGVATDHSLPATNGSIAFPPYRPPGPAFLRLANGRHKAKKSSQWYGMVDLEWEELSPAAYAAVLVCIEALMASADSTVIEFCPKSPFDSAVKIRVVPAIDDDSVKMVYKERVRSRSCKLSLVGYEPITLLPGWVDATS